MPAIAVSRGRRRCATYGRKYDSAAVCCTLTVFEACIAHLRFPVTHRRPDPNDG